MALPFLNFIAGAINGSAPDGGKPGIGNVFANGMASASEGYDKFIDDQNRLQAAGKAGKYYFEANPSALQEMGKTPEEAKNFGSRDWAALAQAHTQKQTLAELMAKIGEQKAQTAATQQNTQFKGEMQPSVANEMLARIDEQKAQTQQALSHAKYFDARGVMDQQEQQANQNFQQEFSGQRPAAQSMASLMQGQGPVRNQTATPMDIGRLMLDSGIAPERILPHLGQLLAGSDQIDSTPKFMTGPNGETIAYQPGTRNPFAFSPFSKADARVREINAQAESNSGKGLLPEGTTFSTTPNGLAIAELPDGSIKHLGRAPTAPKERKSFFQSFMDNAGGTNAPAGKPAAKLAGKVVVQNGNRFQINADGSSNLLGPAN